MPRAAKLTLVIGAAVVAFVAVLWLLVVRTGAAKDYVAGRIVSAARQQGLILEIGNTGISLFGPAVTLNDVVVRAAQASDLPPILSAKDIRLKLGLGALLSGSYVLDEAIIKDPQVHAVITERGNSNLPTARGGGGQPSGSGGQASGGGAQQAEIPKLRATGGSLQLDDRRDRVFVHFPEWKLSLQPEREASRAGIEFKTGAPGSISYQKRQIVVKEINLDSVARPNGTEIRKLELTTQAGRITASGAADLAGQPTLNLRGTVALALPQLTRIGGIWQAPSGELNGTFTAAGPLDQLRVQTDLHGNRIPLAGFERPVVKADATYLRRQQRIDVHSLAVNASAADFNADGVVALRATEPSTMQARIKHVNLQQITSRFASPYILASRGTGTAQVRWPGLEFKQAGGRADLQLTALLPSPVLRVLPASGPLTIASRNRQVQVSTNALSALSAQWNGNVTVAELGKLGGTVRGQTSDAGQMLSQLQVFLGRRQPLVPVNVRGAAAFAVNLGGTTQQPTAGLTVRAPSLNVGRFDNTSLTARAQYSPKLLHVQQADLRWKGQTLTVQGNIGLGGDAAPLDLTARAQGTAAAALLGGANVPAMPAIPSLPSIPGLSQQLPQIALQAHIGGTTAAPRVTLTEPAGAGL